MKPRRPRYKPAGTLLALVLLGTDPAFVWPGYSPGGTGWLLTVLLLLGCFCTLYRMFRRDRQW